MTPAMPVWTLPPVRNGLVAYYPMRRWRGHNLVTNPGFEDYSVSPGTPPGWSTVGPLTYERETVLARSGNAVKITASSALHGGLRQALTVTAGRSYRVEAWARTSGVAGEHPVLTVRNTTDLNDALVVNGTDAGVAYERLHGSFVPVAGKAYEVRVLHSGTPNAGDIVYFDDVSVVEERVLDVAGGHRGVPTGMTWGASGLYGAHGVFDGVDDVLSVAHDAALNFDTGDDFSISLWFRTTQAPAASVDLLTKWEGSGAGYPYGVRLAPSLKMVMVRYDLTNGPSVTSTMVVNDGVWRHAVAQKDGGTLRLYINGVRDAKSTDTTTATTVNTHQLSIGARGNNTFFFAGDVRDVALYNRALSAHEIRTLYQSHPLHRVARVGGDA